MRGPMGPFCETMETAYNPKGRSEGIFATETRERGVEAFSKAIKAFYSSNNDTSDLNELESLTWNWQYCSEVGGFQVSNTSRPENLMPSFINVTAEIQMCVDTFGISEKIGWKGPNVDIFNQKYGGWNTQGSNVLFTDGEFDPWRALSVNSKFAPANLKAADHINACGETYPAGTQLRYVIKDGAHGSDLTPGTDVEDAARAHVLWVNALRIWLSCNTSYIDTSSAAAPSATPVADGSFLELSFPIPSVAVPSAIVPSAIVTSAVIPSIVAPVFTSLLARSTAEQKPGNSTSTVLSSSCISKSSCTANQPSSHASTASLKTPSLVILMFLVLVTSLRSAF
ncbi:hypothetical protein ABW20_dc0102185 [Dactylellina cionopaga]|nr:hypothetical protein ABW20_dc0102185 [Dactylellina cionopaga]